MIDIISGQDLRGLAETKGEHCVSMFLPTHRSGDQTAQDPIRFRNLLTTASRELRALGLRSTSAESHLQQARALLDDTDFWAHLEAGLAIFVDPVATRTFRLPDPVDELVVVADRLHLKPLLPSVTTGELYYLLALSQGRVRLLRGSRFGVSELDLGAIPDSLATALLFDDREAQLQGHGAGRVGTGQVTATFHGHGVGKDTRDADLTRFLGAVDGGVGQVIPDRSVPLVLAGVDYLVAGYRGVSDYPNLVGPAISGNPEMMSADDLHVRAWPLVEPVFEESRRRAQAAFLAGTDLTSRRLDETVVASKHGRVASLFVPVGIQRWGVFDVERQLVIEHQDRQPGDRDLLDSAAIETLAHGGEVYAVAASEVPGDGPVAAVMRF